jgi:hypothetical protein
MMMILALVLGIASPASDGAIRSEQLGDGRYRLTLEAPGVATPEAGQARLLPEARRLCGALQPRFGTFRWESLERKPNQGPNEPVSLRLQQEISCGRNDASAPAPASEAAAAFQPNPADLKAVLDGTAHYLTAKDAGRDDETWALLTQTMQAMSPREQWHADAARSRAQTGRVTIRTPVAVTWYDHPADAPVAGVYAAVDYVGEAQKASLCGYVVWFREADGSWRLTRDEQTQIDRAGLAHSTPEHVAELRTAMHCAK